MLIDTELTLQFLAALPVGDGIHEGEQLRIEAKRLPDARDRASIIDGIVRHLLERGQVIVQSGGVEVVAQHQRPSFRFVAVSVANHAAHDPVEERDDVPALTALAPTIERSADRLLAKIGGEQPPIADKTL